MKASEFYMLELEKKHWKEYRTEKKEMKEYEKICTENKNNFYKVFNYIKREYYYSLKKEFTDSEIIEKCNVSEDIFNEIKSFLESKELAKVTKNKLMINYETILFLDGLATENKKRAINGGGIVIFLVAIIVLILTLIGNFILKNLKALLIVICAIVIICIIGIIIHKMIEKS